MPATPALIARMARSYTRRYTPHPGVGAGHARDASPGRAHGALYPHLRVGAGHARDASSAASRGPVMQNERPDPS